MIYVGALTVNPKTGEVTFEVYDPCITEADFDIWKHAKAKHEGLVDNSDDTVWVYVQYDSETECVS